MKLFLAVSAVLAFIFGFALLFVSSSFYAPMGIAVTPAIAVTAQAQGAILVGIGALNWTARTLPPSVVRPVLVGNLVIQALSLAVIARALVLHIVPAQNAGAVVVHTVLGAGFAYFLAKSRRMDAMAV
jgi:hypothetical protein